MKILVYVHQLVFGGTTVNSVELAAALRDRHGHEVVLFAGPGPMRSLVEEKGLQLLPAPPARAHPSPARMRALREAVRRERPDLLYVWDTWACIDAYFGVYLTMRMPTLVTDMQMHVTRLLPKELPITFGTPELVETARAGGWHRARLLLPPVDDVLNAPGAVDPAPFRARWDLRPDDVTLVVVSRLAETMKAEGLVRTIEAVRRLASELPLRLLVVGDGSARAHLEQRAARVNAEVGRKVVTLVGAMVDPRPAYAAADIVIGMGSSALRGMAFRKPVVVVGERGFSATFDPGSSERFYREGLYGIGDGRADNEQLVADLRRLATQPRELPVLGEFSRRFVERHFALDVIADQLSALCSETVKERPRGLDVMKDGLRTAAVYLRERRFLWRT